MNLPHIETGVWAMPFGPLWRASQPSLLRVSGIAGIAIALLAALYFGLQMLRGVL